MAVTKSKVTKKKKVTKNLDKGAAYIHASFNNTIITITDNAGNTVSWSSAGSLGLSGARKSTPYAAQQAAEIAAKSAKEQGIKSVTPGQACVFYLGEECLGGGIIKEVQKNHEKLWYL